MRSKLFVAGAATALLIGGVAIAQTAQQNGPAAPPSATGATSGTQSGSQTDRSTSGQMDQSQTGRSMSGDVTTPSAGTYGSDTAAAADDQSMQMAGERG